MSVGDQLSDEYEEYKRRSRMSAPFIYEEDGTLTLYFEMGSAQSRMHADQPDFLMLGYTRTMMGFLLFNKRPRHIGTIGLGGGSIQKHCYRCLPHTRISVAEISPEVIALRDDFYIPKDDFRFKVFCEDGADFVFRHSNEFDVLIVDGFDITGQPAQLCSQRFYDNCYNALTPDGVMVVNLSDHGYNTLLGRIREGFQNHVVVVGCDDGENQIAFAGKGNAFAFARSGNAFKKYIQHMKQYHPIKFN
jgi:spermidine synthase